MQHREQHSSLLLGRLSFDVVKFKCRVLSRHCYEPVDTRNVFIDECSRAERIASCVFFIFLPWVSKSQPLACGECVTRSFRPSTAVSVSSPMVCCTPDKTSPSAGHEPTSMSVRVHMLAHPVHTYIHTPTHAYTCTTHTHTSVHTRAHTHTHMLTHTNMPCNVAVTLSGKTINLCFMSNNFCLRLVARSEI